MKETSIRLALKYSFIGIILAVISGCFPYAYTSRIPEVAPYLHREFPSANDNDVLVLPVSRGYSLTQGITLDEPLILKMQEMDALGDKLERHNYGVGFVVPPAGFGALAAEREIAQLCLIISDGHAMMLSLKSAPEGDSWELDSSGTVSANWRDKLIESLGASSEYDYREMPDGVCRLGFGNTAINWSTESRHRAVEFIKTLGQ